MKMKVISIWQPFASLIVHNHKFIETRGWDAPKSLIGETIAIASTKIIRPEQKAYMRDPEFMKFYQETGLPGLEELPLGCVLGTVQLHSSDVMTEEDLEEVTDEEQMFGDWEVGHYAWRLRHPRAFQYPVPCVGKQGIWEWEYDEVFHETRRREAPAIEGPKRNHLHLV